MTPPDPPLDVKSIAWHALPAGDALQKLDTTKAGLTPEQAKARLSQYGPNKLDESPPTSFWKLLWDQFNDFVVWLLATLLSGSQPGLQTAAGRSWTGAHQISG